MFAVWAMLEIMFVGMLLSGVMVLLVGLAGWFGNTPNEYMAGATIFCGMGLFIITGFGVWTLCGLFVVYSFLWQLTGVERIEVDA
jgi:hypothetical protein